MSKSLAIPLFAWIVLTVPAAMLLAQDYAPPKTNMDGVLNDWGNGNPYDPSGSHLYDNEVQLLHNANYLYGLVPPGGDGTRNVVRDFVYGCWCNGKRIGGMQMPPLNELYATTHARAGGLEADFVDAQVEIRVNGQLVKSSTSQTGRRQHELAPATIKRGAIAIAFRVVKPAAEPTQVLAIEVHLNY